MPLAELLDRTGLGRDAIANRGRKVDIETLQRLLPDAVARARELVVTSRGEFEDRINEKLNHEILALDKLKSR